MNDATRLERRYRRLLAWYPAEHRRNWGEDMIGVLMSSAADGRSRPGIADTTDLINGAARVRLRALLAGAPDPGWRDALAASSLLAPVLMIVLLLGQNLSWMATLLWHSWTGQNGILGALWTLPVLLVPSAVGMLRLRRTAAFAAAVLLAWIVSQAALGHALEQPRLAGYLVLLGVQIVALAVSEGPRRGLQLLSAKATLLAVPWLATVAYAAGVIPTHYPVPLVVAQIVIALVVVGALPSLASAQGRRLLVLVAGIPGSAFVISLLTFAGVNFYALSFAPSQAALYLPPALLACLTVLAIRRSSRKNHDAAA